MSTGIEWTDDTWNPVVGCTKVSQGCKFCYAKTLHDMRHAAVLAGKQLAPQYAEPFERVQLMPDRLTKPLSWREPRRIFVNSVSDLFHEDVPMEYIARVFAVMYLAPRHTFQVLTKRPARMGMILTYPGFYRMVLDAAAEFRAHRSELGDVPISDPTNHPAKHVHLGVSVENQHAADERIPLLLLTPAAIRWLSCEPLLGPIDIRPYVTTLEGVLCCPRCGFRTNRFSPCPNDGSELVRDIAVDWVVVGGESGSSKQNPRAMHPDWARSLRDQCVDAGVPFLFKQWGDWVPVAAPHLKTPSERRALLHVDGRMTGPPCGPELALHAGDPWHPVERMGKKRAGRHLDGRTWDEYPAPSAEASR